jgi:GT2 family glycosyltransferase
MPTFRNNSNHPLPIMINGSRRLIKPNQMITGPDSLGTINGLVEIDPQNKTVIPKKSVPKQTQQHEHFIDSAQMAITHYTSINEYAVNEINYIKKHNVDTLPYVSIVILTKNSLDLIKDCCNSILHKVRYPNYSIIIADTGTTDAKVLQYYMELKESCKSINKGFKFIKVGDYHFGKNYNNVIFNNISSEYVIIQNNDTVAINDYVSKMMSVAVINKVGSVGCRMFYRDMTIQHDGQFIYSNNGQLSNPGHINLKVNKARLGPEHHNITQVDGNTAACVLMKTENYLKIGGFDEQYTDIFQDVDLMLKVSHSLSKQNYCDRSAEIYHYDNTSRLKEGFRADLVQKMQLDSKYLHAKAQQKGWKYKKYEPVYDFSIVTVVTDSVLYENLVRSIQSSDTKLKVEFIGIPNKNRMYKDCSYALNVGKRIASGKYIISIHQDVLVGTDWLNKINATIKTLNSRNIQWGVLGPAGITIQHKPYYYLLDSENKPVMNIDLAINEVFTLDEVCLITRNDNVFFNENIEGFHFYGAELCINYKHQGKQCICY